MMWRNIQYDFPEGALLLFFVLAIVLAYIYLYRFRKHILAAFANPQLLKVVMEPRLRLSYWIKTLLITLAWICAVIALMGPKGNERYISPEVEQAAKVSQRGIIRQKAHDVIFLIDASASMSVTDISTGKSRLEEAKEIADEIISRLHGGERVSLHAFTTATIGLSPPTIDYLFVRLMLNNLDVNEGETEGTDILQAMVAMRELYFGTPSPVRKTLILFSDGGDTKLESLKGNEREAYIHEILHTVEDASTVHLRVFAVGIGSKEGKEIPKISYQGHPILSALDPTLLRKLSDYTGGQVYFDREATTLQIADAIAEDIAREPPYYEEKEVSARRRANSEDLIYDHYYQWPLAVAVISLALSLLIPETLRRTRKP